MISHLKISKANLADCKEIIILQKLAYECEAKLYDNWSLPPLTQTLEALEQEFLQFTLLKAAYSGTIIGSVRAKLINNICHIGRLIVHPSFQKQGIGSGLLREIEQEFSQAEIFELFTGSKSKNNIRLYTTQGYYISHTNTISDQLSLVYLRKLNTRITEFELPLF